MEQHPKVSILLCVCLAVTTIQALPVIILLGDSVPLLDADNTLLQNYILDLAILNSDKTTVELQKPGSISFEDDIEQENSEDKSEEYEIIVLNFGEDLKDVDDIIEETNMENSTEQANDLEMSDEDKTTELMQHEDTKSLE
eukprot:TRINITY_DN3819_c0_g1_i2.p1 TRINITY_DN3819_c0_g1~~TRINITY_DN3819_c0_g1_i2.p1  ORF type:complete len:141 (-),score=52.13 TRINITY_DN3819_c0_g1_i2:12-434(-)